MGKTAEADPVNKETTAQMVIGKREPFLFVPCQKEGFSGFAVSFF